jgi:hypothetical protein
MKFHSRLFERPADRLIIGPGAAVVLGISSAPRMPALAFFLLSLA